MTPHRRETDSGEVLPHATDHPEKRRLHHYVLCVKANPEGVSPLAIGRRSFVGDEELRRPETFHSDLSKHEPREREKEAQSIACSPSKRETQPAMKGRRGTAAIRR